MGGSPKRYGADKARGVRNDKDKNADKDKHKEHKEYKDKDKDKERGRSPESRRSRSKPRQESVELLPDARASGSSSGAAVSQPQQPPHPPPAISELEAQFAELRASTRLFQQQLAAQITSSNAEAEKVISDKNDKLLSQVTALVEQSTEKTLGLLKTMETHFSERFARMDAALAATVSTTDRHERMLQEFELRFKKMEQGVRVLEEPETTKKVRDYDLYDRTPDLSILRIGTDRGQEVTRAEVEKAIQPWMADSRVENYTVEGRDVGKFFTLKVNGNETLAARRVREAHALLRTKDGVWQEFYAPSATNSRLEVKLYLNFDQSKKTAREAGATRGLIRSLRAMAPDKKFRIIENSTVLVEGKPLARIAAPDPEADVKIQYIESAFTTFNIDKEDLKERFATGGHRAPAEDAWSTL